MALRSGRWGSADLRSRDQISSAKKHSGGFGKPPECCKEGYIETFFTKCSEKSLLLPLLLLRLGTHGLLDAECEASPYHEQHDNHVHLPGHLHNLLGSL